MICQSCGLEQCKPICGGRRQSTYDTVNRLLPAASPVGAYCLGLVCALAWDLKTEPSESLLHQAVTCEQISDAVRLWRLEV